MATTRYTDSGVSPRTNVYATKQALEHQAPYVVLDRFGDVKPMPKNRTQRIKFRRPRVFSAVSTPLVEGVTPTATQFSYEDVEGQLEQYGQLVEITDHIEDTHEDPVLKDAVLQCSENIARTQEDLRYGVLRAGTNVYYSGTAASRSAVTAPMTLLLQRKITRGLKSQKAMKLREILSGSVMINTTPIEASYVAVTHTDLEHDIRQMQGFVPTAQYGSRKLIHECEIGAVEDVRYCLSPDLPPHAGAGASGADVYPILFFGKHAYGHVPLRGENAMEPHIIPVGQISKSDPLGQRGYAGFKFWFLCLILNDVWMARAEVAIRSLSDTSPS